MSIAIIDYRAGNLTSVQLALETIGVEGTITSDPSLIESADRVIFPGVGAAGSAMQNLKDLSLPDVIRRVVEKGVPFLGICVGMQLCFDRSEENDGTDALGLLPGEVRLFRPEKASEKVPQMGWNSVRYMRSHAIFDGIEDESEFYFVHSYYPAPADPGLVIGQTSYGGVDFASCAGRDNLVTTQFHPEKSGRPGLRLLKNFCDWDGSC